ncbi:hypothetical protein [Actinomadura coerulea]|uniref:hypothetical protein n=1 Tax=Actinomadura coerulea TaxID=46159 RepID=UPI003430C261
MINVSVQADVHIIAEDGRDTVDVDLEATGETFEKAAEQASLNQMMFSKAAVLSVVSGSAAKQSAARSILSGNTFNGPVFVTTGSGSTQSVHFEGGRMDVHSGDGRADGSRPSVSSQPQADDGSLKITVKVPNGVPVSGLVRGGISVSGGYDRNLFTIEPSGGAVNYL